MVDAILDRIARALADGDRVELRDFGAFGTKEMRPRTGRNPCSGQSVAVAAKRSVQFKPGKGDACPAEPQAGGPGARDRAAAAGLLTALIQPQSQS